MKKTLSILIVMLAFVLISCSPNMKSPENEKPNQETTESEDTDQGQVNKDYLIVLTNIDDDTIVSRTISKDLPLKGVLLKYQNEGLFSKDSEITLNNKNAFYFEYLGEEASYFNGDKMEFNAVLYVPDCIPQAYSDGNGFNPNSGNPFWWYMSTYLNKSYNEIRSDWVGTINYLLTLRSEKLPMPKAEDVVNSWEKKDNNSLMGKRIFSGKWNEDHTYRNVKATKIEYHKEDDEWVLYCPSMLNKIYVAGGGNVLDCRINSIYWYIETFYHKTPEEVDLMVKNGEFESFLDAQEYVEPKESDVNVYANTIVSMILPDNIDSLFFADIFYYKSGRLSLLDGSTVPDDNRIYFIQEGENIKFFFPQSLRDYIERANGMTWTGTGDLLWSLLREILPKDVYDGITDHKLPRDIILKVLGTYVDSEGNLVTPSI